MTKDNYDRGQIVEAVLPRPIHFNGMWIKKAVIEIDHINYGLNKKTNKLNRVKRTNFSVRDILKFISLLHEEDQVPGTYRGMRSRFAIRVDCPVFGRFFRKEFLMIFETDYEKKDLIYSITLVPNW